MSLSKFVHAMGRGPGRARSLTQEEASEAMALILSGDADPHAVGALLMLMRFRGEIAPEIAGFVTAMRAEITPWTGARPAIDWPSYAAGRTRGVPWFLLAAKLVAGAGHPVLLHGWNSHQNPIADVRGALPEAGIREAQSVTEAGLIMDADGIAYLPLEAFAPELLRLLRLREVLGLRSAVNTCLRVLNPGGAAVSVQGVFHPPYRELQMDAGAILDQPAMTVIKGGGGEFERHPSKTIELFGLKDGTPWQASAAPILDETRRLADTEHTPTDLSRLWSGELEDPFAEAVVLGTAALALEAAGEPEGLAKARNLWQNRPKG